jgi:hypothetical protein
MTRPRSPRSGPRQSPATRWSPAEATRREQRREIQWLVAGVAFVLIVVALSAIDSSMPATGEQRGQFGDPFGLATCLFTGLGLVGLGVTLVFERRKLRELQLTSFENELNREYRQLVGKLPVDAFVPSKLPISEELVDRHLSTYYQYFDLCNSQMFFREQGRISAETWRIWCEGILDNMRLPGFKRAWDKVRDSRRDASPDASGRPDGHLRLLWTLVERSKAGLRQDALDPANGPWDQADPEAEPPGNDADASSIRAHSA